MIAPDAVGEDGGGCDGERVRDEDVVKLTIAKRVSYATAKGIVQFVFNKSFFYMRAFARVVNNVRK